MAENAPSPLHSSKKWGNPITLPTWHILSTSTSDIMFWGSIGSEIRNRQPIGKPWTPINTLHIDFRYEFERYPTCGFHRDNLKNRCCPSKSHRSKSGGTSHTRVQRCIKMAKTPSPTTFLGVECPGTHSFMAHRQKQAKPRKPANPKASHNSS